MSYSMLLPRVAELLSTQPALAIPIVFAGGVLTSLTPCIYPMIPITAAVSCRLPGTSTRIEVTFRAMASLRRRAIVMAGFLLLHLTVASGVAGCDMKSDQNDVGLRSQGMAGMMATDNSRPSDESAPGRSQSVPECSASVACALAVLPSVVMRYASADLPITEHTRFVAFSPDSRSVAPEPPPPRA